MQMIPCPHCGPREETEFHYGAAAGISYPEQPAEQHKRERCQRPKRGAPNPTGPTTVATGLVTRCHGSPRP